MNKSIQISLDRTALGHAVSQDLYGIFFEDINFSCDGGMNANMVNNYSFDGIYFNNEEKKAVDDPLRYWITKDCTLESGQENPLHKNSRYGRIHTDGHGILSNLGYNGLKAYRNHCAMSIKEGSQYLYECYIRTIDFNGTIRIYATDRDENLLTDQVKLTDTKAGTWQKVSCILKGISTGYGKLQIIFEGNGTIDMDCISLMDSDYWNKEDTKWRYGKLRKDLIQALADLKPAFLRFPGGCIVEGQLPGNEYNWKDTVGELYERKSNYNLWSEKVSDGGYNQSYQIGFYEYFCLCEDLGMKPLPTLSAGLNCQIRSVQRGESECPNIPVDSKDFQTKIVANYLDLIEFATGNPAENEWAALRAKMGHPAPFTIDRIGIGNENYGEDYFKRFEVIEKAIHEKYPDILCILCGGLHPYYQDTLLPGLDRTYAYAKKYKNVLVDEHSYHTPEWFASQSVRFDTYDRNGAGVYFGEYAANSMLAHMEEMLAHAEQTGTPLDSQALSGDSEEGMRPMNESNQLDTALGEAAFLTGLERNSDVVKMSSYAPLLNLVECDQWNHNLINFNPQTLCLTTNYYVQKMFASNLGTQYVPYKGELPKDCYLSATENEDFIYIKLVNTGALEHVFEIQTDTTAESATAKLLAGENAQVRNGLAFYGDPEYVIQPEANSILVKDGKMSIQVKPYSVTVVTQRRS